MELFDYFNTIDLTEVDRFISEGQEENVSLEFKTVNHPASNDISRNDDKKNISKVLSGFSNSNGGIVIWGVKAKENDSNQDVAKEKKPIRELTKFLNMLNRLEAQAVTPIITGVRHEKIEISNDCGYVKTYIPLSKNAPHMANFADKRYFKRSGDSFYQCEHFDIVDMFSRTKQPKIKLLFHIGTLHSAAITHETTLIALNEGAVLAKYLKIYLYVPSQFVDSKNMMVSTTTTKNNVPCHIFEFQNTQRDYIGSSEFNGSRFANYGPVRYEPILPGMKLELDKFPCIEPGLTPGIILRAIVHVDNVQAQHMEFQLVNSDFQRINNF